MKLYLIIMNNFSWDEYDKFLVAANNKKEAIKFVKNNYSSLTIDWNSGYKIKEINVCNIKEACVIMHSFNAG